MLREKAEEAEEPLKFLKEISSGLRQAVFLVFLQLFISLYALWKPPVSQALIKKLDQMIGKLEFPISRFEGVIALSYEQGNLTEVVEQDVSLPKKKVTRLSYDAQGNLKTVRQEWVELEKGN